MGALADHYAAVPTVTRVNIRDLPPDVRRKIEGSTAERTPAPRDKTPGGEARRPPRPPPASYRCGTCGETIGAFAPAQRHANDLHHGARLEVVAAESEGG